MEMFPLVYRLSSRRWWVTITRRFTLGYERGTSTVVSHPSTYWSHYGASDQMNQEAQCPSKVRFKKLIDAVTKHLPQTLSVDHSSIPEDSLVQLSRRSKSSELRGGLAELYRAGYFGGHDVVNGYAWTLAAWNCSHVSYDAQFKLAETQQYYEFFLTADEQAEAIRILERVLFAGKPCRFVAGTPFNANWWGGLYGAACQ